jgi:hypothetical protein
MIQHVLSHHSVVTLNLFQGPFSLFGSGGAARWMLKQVQHDEVFKRQAAL